jgi:hypothetical protein
MQQTSKQTGFALFKECNYATESGKFTLKFTQETRAVAVSLASVVILSSSRSYTLENELIGIN